MLDKVNIFFAVFGVVAVAVGLLTHILLAIIIVGLTFIAAFIVIAIYEKSIKWSAWRVIIALILVSGALFVQYIPPKTEALQIYIPNDLSWDIANPPLSSFPVADDPQTGHQYSNFDLEQGNFYDVKVQCWTAGHLTGKPQIKVDWVSVKGGTCRGIGE